LESLTNNIDIWGIALLGVSVVLITLSKFGTDDFEIDEFESFLLSLGLMLGAVVLIWVRNLLYYYTDLPRSEMIMTHNIVNFIVTLPIVIYFGYVSYTNEFEYSISDVLIGSFGGFLNLVITFMTLTVVVKGKAGTSEALIETSTILQTFLDAFLKFRFPNILQISGIVLAFLASCIIIKANYKH
jgi:hypothetical protein